MIAVCVAYVDADGRQYYQELTVAKGTTIHQLLQNHTAADIAHDTLLAWCAANCTHNPNHKSWLVGIYGQKKRLDTVLADGDRVEIYRALSLDPMAKRKSKAKAKLQATRQMSMNG